jgi:tetratricopeptide (TPR) repeat protein
MYLQSLLKFKVIFFATVYFAPFLAASSALATSTSSSEDLTQTISCPASPQETSSRELVAEDLPVPIAVPVESDWRSRDFLPQVIRGLTEANQLDAALRLVESISDAEDQQYQLYTVLDLLIRTEKYEQLEQTIAQIDAGYPELQPQQLHTLISSFISAGKYNLALQLVQTIRTPELKAQAMEMAVASLAEAGEFDQAQQIAQSIEFDAFQAAALTDIAKELASVGRIEDAQLLFASAIQQAQSLEDSEEQVSTLGYIAQALTQLGWLNDALEIISQMPEINSLDDKYENLRINRIIAVSNHLFGAGNTEQAIQVVQQAIESTFELRDWFNRVSLFSEIATQLITHGQVDQAIELNQAVEERFLSVRRAIAVALTRKNQTALALRISQDSSDPDAVLREIFETIYQQNPSRAFDIARMIRNPGSKAYMLSLLAYYWIGQRQYGRVVNIAQQISTVESDRYTLKQISLKLAEVGEYQFAVQVTGMISNSRQSMEACQTVLVQTVKNLLAADQADRALQVSNTITIPSLYEDAVYEISTYLFRVGKREQALSMAEMIKDESKRSEAFVNFVYSLTDAENYNQALQFVQRISSDDRRLTSLQYITRRLISDQQYDRALEIVQTYSSERTQAEDWSSIAIALIKMGKTERGFELLNRALATADLLPL